MARSIRSSTSRPRAIKYFIISQSTLCTTHAVPVVHFIESSTGHNKGQRLHLGLSSLGVDLLVYCESENTRKIVERFDKLGVIALGRKLNNVEIEIGFGGRTTLSAEVWDYPSFTHISE